MARKTNISINGSDYFKTSTTTGSTPDGNPIRKVFYGKTKKEAESKKAEYLKKLEQGINMDKEKEQLGNLMYSWLFDILRLSSDIKPSTFERYETLYRLYIKDHDIALVPLYKLNSDIIQRHYNSLFEKEGKSSNVILSLNKLLKKFCYYCITQNYIILNPCAGKKINIPTKNNICDVDGEYGLDDGDLDFYTTDEISQIKTGFGVNPVIDMIFLFAIGTGLREGEILALNWNDIRDHGIYVTKTLKGVSIFDENGDKEYKDVIMSPKTQSSRRIVPLQEDLKQQLGRYKIYIIGEKFKNGIEHSDSDYIFCTEQGNSLNARNVQRAYKRLLSRSGVRELKFHSLRHTFATLLFQQSVDLKKISTLLGHSSLAITEKVYTHLTKDDKTNAINAIGFLFKNIN